MSSLTENPMWARQVIATFLEFGEGDDMKLKSIVAAVAVAGSLALPVSAATVSVVVDAKLNSIATNQLGNGLNTTVELDAGDRFTVAVDPADLWSIGTRPERHLGNADGAPVTRLYTFFGQTFSHGTLVGRIGDGLFFKVGTTFLNKVANASGVLRLYMWDANFADNSGDLDVAVITPVPLPAGAPLLLAGLGALVVLRRRKAA
jgi:hypothetical protein